MYKITLYVRTSFCPIWQLAKVQIYKRKILREKRNKTCFRPGKKRKKGSTILTKKKESKQDLDQEKNKFKIWVPGATLITSFNLIF